MAWRLVPRMLLTSIAFATALDSAGAQTRPIDRFSWLVGGIWEADASSLGNGMKQIATRYQWSPNKAYIEFSTTFTSTKGSVVNYSGSLFQSTQGSAASPAYEMWYMDARNAITDGPVSPRSGDDWSLAFAQDSQNYRVDVMREARDRYRWMLYSQAGAEWSLVFALTFVNER